MGRRSKGEAEGSGIRRRPTRLLRGWVRCPPDLAPFPLVPEFDAGAEARRERETESALREEIERAQRAIRSLMGIGNGEVSRVAEEEKGTVSENARLWQAVTHLAATIDLLRQRL